MCGHTKPATLRKIIRERPGMRRSARWAKAASSTCILNKILRTCQVSVCDTPRPDAAYILAGYRGPQPRVRIPTLFGSWGGHMTPN